MTFNKYISILIFSLIFYGCFADGKAILIINTYDNPELPKGKICNRYLIKEGEKSPNSDVKVSAHLADDSKYLNFNKLWSEHTYTDKHGKCHLQLLISPSDDEYCIIVFEKAGYQNDTTYLRLKSTDEPVIIFFNYIKDQFK